MLLIKVVILTVCVTWSGAEDQGYHIRKFQHNPGLYYEKYGTMLHASEKWRLVVRLDVSTVYTRTEHTEHVLEYTIKACENATITHKNRELCEGFAAELQQRLKKVEKVVKRVKTIVGTQKRRRRGLVDAVGSVAKILFGTMDAEDEKRVSEQIELLNKKQAVLQHVVKNQLQVINATIAHVENVEEIVEKNENKLKNAMVKITQQVDSYAQQTELSEYLMEIGSMITELEFDVESIMGYVTDVQAKFAQLEMVPVELIIKSLQDANNWSAHGLHFPFVITLGNWLTIKEYVEVSVYCKNANVYTVVKFPLVAPVEYDLLRVVPLPVHDHDNVFRVAKVKFEIVAIDENKQTYSVVKLRQLEKCKNVGSSYVCDNVESVYKVHADAPCEVQAYVSSSGEFSSCKEENVFSNHTIWIRLEKARVWLYSTPKSESVVISCENRKEATENVNGVGEIKLSEKCKLVTSSVTIRTNKVMNGEQINTYLPRFNLSVFKAKERADGEEPIVLENITHSKTQIEKVKSKITELMDEVNESSFFENPHLIYPTTSGVTIAIVIIVLVIYKVVKNREKAEVARVAVKSRNAEQREKRRNARAQNVETVAL